MIIAGTVIKAKVGELEEEVREGILWRSRKELTGVVQGASGKKRFLVRFQDGYEKDLTLNQLTVVIVAKIPRRRNPRCPQFL